VELRPPLAATAFDECFSTSDSHTKQLFASSTCSSQGFYAVTGWDPPITHFGSYLQPNSTIYLNTHFHPFA